MDSQSPNTDLPAGNAQLPSHLASMTLDDAPTPRSVCKPRSESERTAQNMFLKLDGDDFVEICSFLSVEDLLSVVKALEGAPQYASIYQRVASIEIFYNSLTHPYLQAEVMAHLRRVVWHTDSLQVAKFLAYKFPGYLFSVVVDLLEVEFSSVNDLPPNTTQIDLKLRNKHLQVVADWPAQLRVLQVSSDMRQIRVEPPPELAKLNIAGTRVLILAVPDVDYLGVFADSVEIAGKPLKVKELELMGKSSPSEAQAIVDRCRDLRVVKTRVGGLSYPESVRSFDFFVCQFPDDPRVNAVVLFNLQYSLTNLRELTVLSDDLDGLAVPETVSRLTLIGLDSAGYTTNPITALRGVKNPAGVTYLRLQGTRDEWPDRMPLLKNWTALRTMVIQHLTIQEITLKAPLLEELVIEEAYLRELDVSGCPKLRLLLVPDNMLREVPAIPRALEYLCLAKNLFEAPIFINSPNITTLLVQGNDKVKRVIYNSRRLHTANADWENLDYFGGVRSGKLQLPQYILGSGSPVFDMARYEFHPNTTKVTQRIDSMYEMGFPPAVEVMNLTFILYDLLALAKLWRQAPNLRCLTVNFTKVKRAHDFNQVWLPLQLEYVSLKYLPTDPTIYTDEETPEAWLMFNSKTTRLEWLHVENRLVRWETLGGRLCHPNLKFVNGKDVKFLKD